MNFGWWNRYPGIRKSKIDQISEREFSIGVPVSAKWLSACSRFTFIAFSEVEFFIFWASSMMTAAKCNPRYSDISLRSSGYDVIRIPFFVSLTRLPRSSGMPHTTVHGSPGAKFSISSFQLNIRDEGQITIERESSGSDARYMTDCSVLPRPMSSARMPPIPKFARFFIQ